VQKNKTVKTDRLTFTLGSYLLCCTAYEVALINRGGILGPMLAALGVLARYVTVSNIQFAIFQCVIVATHFGFAVSCFVKHPLLKSYLVMELPIALPAAFVAITVLIHGGGEFGTKFVVVVWMVLVFFSIVPMGLAFTLLLAQRSENGRQ